ncbi:MFS transporter [Actinomycetospora endophytica]|uniref:MFS transporter n=1 Tax=Actinomycetospora endophytica TaxID=2291215 RepID=A0ABS8PCN9_9PSEU|nr:MFS transporter [Actinomycetospora endophytica]MCD2195260.1 MFS transporter [Actinomycetospora endophytica]
MGEQVVHPVGRRRALIGAALLDLAVSPLFAWGVFTGPLRRELGADDAWLAGVFSVGLVAFMLGVLLGGRAADLISPRRLAAVTALGAVAGLAGSAAAGSVGLMMLTFGGLLGGSTGVGYATAVRVAATVGSRRGLALGLVVGAYAVGTAVLAPISAALLAAYGRGPTFLLLAVAVGAVLSLAAALVPGGPGRRKGREPRTSPAGRAHVPSRPVVALWLVFLLGSAAALAAFAHAGQLSGSAAVAVAVALLNLGNLAGRLLAGPVSDRLGRSATLHGQCALLVLACVPLALGAAGPWALVALSLLGVQYGALSTLTPAAVSDVVPAERFGATYGLVFTGWGLAGLVAPVAAAALATGIGFDGVYRGFLVIGALTWICVIAFTRARPGPPTPES